MTMPNDPTRREDDSVEDAPPRSVDQLRIDLLGTIVNYGWACAGHKNRPNPHLGIDAGPVIVDLIEAARREQTAARPAKHKHVTHVESQPGWFDAHWHDADGVTHIRHGSDIAVPASTFVGDPTQHHEHPPTPEPAPRRMMGMEWVCEVAIRENEDCLHQRGEHDENPACSMEAHRCQPLPEPE